MSISKKEALVYLVLVVLGASYLYYLNAGCGAPLHTGVMTAHGKVCLN